MLNPTYFYISDIVEFSVLLTFEFAEKSTRICLDRTFVVLNFRHCFKIHFFKFLFDIYLLNKQNN